MFKLLRKNIAYIAWIQTLIAVLSSLYFSEVRHFAPCILCWYQRIFMYPLAIIIPVGILRRDKKLYEYVLPLSILGLLVAFYQVLLGAGILSERLAPCTQGVSCTTKYVSYFGFVTIPVLSLAAFALITVCMLILKKNK